MIERICPKCNIVMNSERCVNPKCGQATKMTSTIYWCKDCNVPIYDKICPVCNCEGRYIATDVRPVFPEENALISILSSGDPFKYQKDSVWFGSNSYIVNGSKIKISITKANKMSLDEIFKIKELYESKLDHYTYDYFDDYKERFIKANIDRYNEITDEATREIQKYKDRYDLEDMMVSFSGGKDSTVTSHLVRTALGSNNILHIFGDTTLEFPYTLEYKKRFNRRESDNEASGVKVLVAKNREKNFEDLCKIVGPPSRVMRWCCTVFKTGAIQKTISSAFKDKTILRVNERT